MNKFKVTFEIDIEDTEKGVKEIVDEDLQYLAGDCNAIITNLEVVKVD